MFQAQLTSGSALQAVWRPCALNVRADFLYQGWRRCSSPSWLSALHADHLSLAADTPPGQPAALRCGRDPLIVPFSHRSRGKRPLGRAFPPSHSCSHRTAAVMTAADQDSLSRQLRAMPLPLYAGRLALVRHTKT